MWKIGHIRKKYMPPLFDSGKSETLIGGENYLYSKLIPLVSGNNYPKSLTLFIKTNGSGTFSIKMSVYNGFDYTDYYDIKNIDGETTFTFGNSYSFNLREQEWFNDNIGGAKILFTRLSGSGDVLFSNGVIYATY